MFVQDNQTNILLSSKKKKKKKTQGLIKSWDGSVPRVASVDNHSCVTLNGEKFGQTVRVAKCANVTKCDSCKNYHPTLRALYHQHLKEVASPKW